ncbi:MAG: S-methyl-5-thioribose-1-phosphate isomerase [Planctomycetota bacterium]|nr:S-methyl-5-thioribose-1-phosphate isomerase [Planctomycetota bacterium]
MTADAHLAHWRVPPSPVTPLTWRGGWRDGVLDLLDQTRLPRHELVVAHTDAETVIAAIRGLAVRGAPILGVAGAYALVLAARAILQQDPTLDRPTFLTRLTARAAAIARARPTAVNLPAAISRHLALAHQTPGSPEQLADALLAAAQGLDAYERAACAAIGRHGAEWLKPRARFLTHCNAGALVTTGIGTALAPLYVLRAAGYAVHVHACETRPLLQGLRLTAYELSKAGIPHRVLADGAAAGLLRTGEIDAVIVGADRIAANGDVANKVGTYALALAAFAHGVPFVVAAPLTTLDPETPDGTMIAVEMRPDDQRAYLDPNAHPLELRVHAPAFDVTPAKLVTCLVTEAGILETPDNELLAPWLLRAARLQQAPPADR